MDHLFIRELVRRVINGQLRVPAFQRGFVWDANRVAYLMDSIYKGYPFGAVLLWRTRERLKFERKLGPFALPASDPDFPVDYILDGQQRITSIFGVFQTELAEDGPDEWTSVFFDFRADPDKQESQFVVLDKADFDRDRYFPLRTLFDTTGYRKATEKLDADSVMRIDQMQSVFKESTIPVQMLSSEDRTAVAIVFERVNQRGEDLDTFQLLSAWTWSEEFDLQHKFNELSEELEPFGFKDVGLDSDLLLRCCSAVLTGEATTKALMGLNGAVVRERFQEVTNGLKGAIDFLRDNLHVHSLDNLPYAPLLIPLTSFFAVPGNEQVRYSDDQRRTILRWFWRTCFSRRYASQPVKTIQSDIAEILKLKRRQANSLDAISVTIKAEFFKQTKFRANTVNTKSFILLLAHEKPRSFISGSEISLREVLRDFNRNEFHHLYPQAYLRDKYPMIDAGCLANFSFMSRADNGNLGGVSPSHYKPKMPPNLTQVLTHAICPVSLFNDDFAAFVDERSQLLADKVASLLD